MPTNLQPHTLPWALARVGKGLIIITVAIGVIFIPVGWLWSGSDGMMAGVLATVITALLALVTWGIDKAVVKNIDLMSSLIFAGYVGKLLIVVIAVIAIKKSEIADPKMMFIALLLAILGLSLAQIFILTKARIYTVDKTEDDAIE